ESSAYRQLYQRAKEARARLAELERRDRERHDLLELARFRLAELESAHLVAGEDDELASERLVLANATRLAEAASAAEQTLYGSTLESAIETLEHSRAEIAELEATAETRAAASADMQQLLGQLFDAARQLSHRRERDALELKQRMESELKTLGMRNAEFEARI